jgi:catechol 2,3-dioxygenase-like lactoylglutathione lyase family enzyme
VVQFAQGGRIKEEDVGKLRHFAMSVPDPWKTAEFYKYAFGMEVAGETDSSLAEGVFLSDGVINLALLHFKSDEAAQGTGRDHVGLHHFGVWVDDPEAVQERIERAGGEWVMGEPDVKGGSFYEVKFRDPNGVIFDLSHAGWGGAQKNPGGSANEVGPSRGLVPKFADRRAAAAAEMAARIRKRS